MRRYEPGDRSCAICATCGLVGTTFSIRDVPLDDGSATVRDLLVGVCDTCGEVVSIPPQSVEAIRRARLK